MKLLTAQEIMGWSIFNRIPLINGGVLLPIYAPFVEELIRQCGFPPGDKSQVAVLGTGFRFDQLDQETIVALLHLHEGHSWETLMESFAQEIRSEMRHDSPDVMNLALRAEAIDERKAALLETVPNLLAIVQTVADIALDLPLRKLPPLTHLYLCTYDYTEVQLQQFLNQVPLVLHDGRVVRAK